MLLKNIITELIKIETVNFKEKELKKGWTSKKYKKMLVNF